VQKYGCRLSDYVVNMQRIAPGSYPLAVFIDYFTFLMVYLIEETPLSRVLPSKEQVIISQIRVLNAQKGFIVPAMKKAVGRVRGGS
jgi:hypothetical protein